MVAYMTAGSDGKLVAYTVANSPLPEGPNVAGSNISTDRAFSAQVTVLGSVGSNVVYGDLQMVPVGDSLLWVRPVYVESVTEGQPQVRLIVAYYDGEVGFGESLGAALGQLFPGLDVEIGDVSGVDVEPTEPSENPDATATELLQEADDLFDEAEQALADGDLGAYQVKIEEARAKMQQALDLLDE